MYCNDEYIPVLFTTAWKVPEPFWYMPYFFHSMAFTLQMAAENAAKLLYNVTRHAVSFITHSGKYGAFNIRMCFDG